MASGKRSRPKEGYYKSLNSVSTVDFLVPKTPCKSKGKKSCMWEVERLITSRRTKDGKTEYLVLWKGFSPYEASWQEEEDITFECIRLFKKPQPSEETLLAEVAVLRSAVEDHLKSKSRLPVTIPFRADVFRFLFGSKGELVSGWLYLKKQDFTLRYFPLLWDYCADSHGQGIKVFYPIKFRHFISCSTRKYFLGKDSNYQECPRAFFEKLTFSFVKVALEDESE